MSVASRTSAKKARPLYTAAEVMTMGDIGPFELVEGEIKTMSPTGRTHGRIEGLIYQAIAAIVDKTDRGEVLVGEVGIYVKRNPDTVRAADLVFISHQRLAQSRSAGYLEVPPELIVEIMSPDDRWGAMQKKLRDYFAFGVDAVVVVAPEDRSVFVYRSMTRVQEYIENDTVTIDDLLPGFNMPIATLFAAAE